MSRKLEKKPTYVISAGIQRMRTSSVNSRENAVR